MSKKRVISELEKLKEENEVLREEKAKLEKKLISKREKLKRSNENLLELAEKRAVEILRNEERYNRIVVHVAKGGIANFNDSPKSPPTSPKKGF